MGGAAPLGSNPAIASAGAAVVGAVALLGPPLVLTIAIELPVAALMGLRGWRALSAVALASAVTNPALNLALVAMGASPDAPIGYWTALAVLEALAVLAEWRLLLWVLGGSSGRMLLVSAAMNAASFVIGSWLLGAVLRLPLN